MAKLPDLMLGAVSWCNSEMQLSSSSTSGKQNLLERCKIQYVVQFLNVWFN